jgi:hypothetical protein
MTAGRISGSTALTFPARLLTWCCITTVGAGWPSTGANAGCMSTASGCPPSSSVMVGPSLSAIRTTGPDWSSSSAHRCPCHRGMRRRLGCGPRRRPPARIANRSGKPGHRPLNHHPGRIGRTDRRFHRRHRPPCRSSRHRPASAQRRNRISRYRPPNNLPPNDFRRPRQSQKRHSPPPSQHRHRRLSATRQNRIRSYPPANFRRSSRHRPRRIRYRRHRPRRIRYRRPASRSRDRSPGRRQRTRHRKLSRNRRQLGPRSPNASGHRLSGG